MPIYEYVCLDCGERFETIRLIKDADLKLNCVNCDSEHTSRMISLFYAQSGGKVIAGGNATCGSCSGGSCAGCGVNH
jgi:putative FmdB family regulatory protein